LNAAGAFGALAEGETVRLDPRSGQIRRLVRACEPLEPTEPGGEPAPFPDGTVAALIAAAPSS
jgi:hypothetical protein